MIIIKRYISIYCNYYKSIYKGKANIAKTHLENNSKCHQTSHVIMAIKYVT